VVVQELKRFHCKNVRETVGLPLRIHSCKLLLNFQRGPATLAGVAGWLQANTTCIALLTSDEYARRTEIELAKKKKQGMVNPTRLATLDKDKKVQVIIETPKGSRNKYAWDPDQQIFTLKKVLPEGMAFPHDFGFIPSTEAEDGDPIDVLVLMDQPVFTGCLVKARLIGVIEGKQTEKGKSERNDRLLAVAESSHTHSDIHSLNDLNKELLKELEQFLVNYHANDGAEFKVLARRGPDAATACLKNARA
jgi:inorganic pyrophosphatase